MTPNIGQGANTAAAGLAPHNHSKQQASFDRYDLKELVTTAAKHSKRTFAGVRRKNSRRVMNIKISIFFHCVWVYS